MPISTTKMTARQFLMLGEDPPGVRLELVNGEVAVSPSPTPKHSHVVTALIGTLYPHVLSHDLGELHQDVDTVPDLFNIRRPDVLFFSSEKAMEGPPDLAVEVISPSSVEVDREDKFNQYLEAGVPYYRIIDPELRTVDAWELLDGNYVQIAHAPGDAIVKLPPFPELEIPLGRLWRREAGQAA